MKIEPLSPLTKAHIEELVEMQAFLKTKFWEVVLMELKIPKEYHE